MKRLLPVVFLLGCSSLGDFGAGARMANTVLAGAACGMAAANGTPCTPQAFLDSLAKDAAALREAQEAQRAKVVAVAPQAASVDAATTKAILEQLAANAKTQEDLAEGQRRLTEAIVLLAARRNEPSAAPPDASSTATPSPTTSSSITAPATPTP